MLGTPPSDNVFDDGISFIVQERIDLTFILNIFQLKKLN